MFIDNIILIGIIYKGTLKIGCIFRNNFIRILWHLIVFSQICLYCDSKRNMLLNMYEKVMKDY